MITRVNPKIDLVFKKLFGSEENKDILLSLINSILPPNQQITKITLKNPYNISNYTEGKLSIMDILAEDQHGKLIDIEMQIKGSQYYGRRALFYWAKIYGSQLDYITNLPTAKQKMSEQSRLDELEKQGKLGFSGLKKCIVISLTDFNFFDDNQYHRFYTLKDGNTNEQHKDLDFLDLYFIELKKYKGKSQNIKTTLERWITFLNFAHRFDHKNLPEELAEVKEISLASQKLDGMYLDKDEVVYYESQQMFWLDQISYMEESISKARDKGIQEGLEQGEQNKQFEIAKNAIAQGFDNQIVAKLTGLTILELDQLRQEKT